MSQTLHPGLIGEPPVGTGHTRSHVSALSFVGPEGFGNHRTGLRPWPVDCREEFRRGQLSRLHWSLVFPSHPSRFARMDLMCRLGLIAVELLDAGWEELPARRREGMAVCVETCVGALGTDVQFLRTPRPTLFTYSLPSTVLGEICIRYGFRGPGLCRITDGVSGSRLLDDATDLLERGEAESCVCVSCDALDADLAHAGVLPEALPQTGWHACAALVAVNESMNQ